MFRPFDRVQSGWDMLSYKSTKFFKFSKIQKALAIFLKQSTIKLGSSTIGVQMIRKLGITRHAMYLKKTSVIYC